MRTLEEIGTDIARAQEELRRLIVERNELTGKPILDRIKKNTIYRFSLPEDPGMIYCGMIYNCYMSGNEYIFKVCGVMQSLHDETWDCWSGFDAGFQVAIRTEDIDDFIDKMVELTPEQFDEHIEIWVNTTKHKLYEWFLKLSKSDEDSEHTEE